MCVKTKILYFFRFFIIIIIPLTCGSANLSQDKTVKSQSASISQNGATSQSTLPEVGKSDSLPNIPENQENSPNHVSLLEHLGHWFGKVTEAVIADFFGFAALGLTLSLMLRKHIKEEIKQGLTFIGKTLAESFEKQLAKPLLVKADEMTTFMRSHSTPGINQENITVSDNVRPLLDEISKLMSDGNLIDSFERLLELHKKYPRELEVLRKLIEVSELSGDQNPKHLEVLRIIEGAEANFKDNPDYFTLLAMCYIGARDVGLRMKMYEGAVRAAKSAFELEKSDDVKPRKESHLSMVYFYFSDVQKAIDTSSSALDNIKKRKTEGARESQARIENNLAFFLAAKGAKEDKELALELAKSALAFDEEKNAVEYLPTSWDTLGYVLFRYATEKKEIEEAISYFDKALSRAPFDADYIKHKTDAERALKA